MPLPTDGHVHSEWSWDAPDGAMRRTCERAVELGLPAVAFTEHADYTRWTVEQADLEDGPQLGRYADQDSVLALPELDVDGYLAAVERCRAEFADLTIISGVELGEAHWHPEEAAALLRAGQFERVLGSLHALPVDDRYFEPPGLFRRRDAAAVVRQYLAEVVALIEGSDHFSVLAHVDYPLRYWPRELAYAPTDFEPELRHALRALASSDRLLEVNTAGPMHPEIVRWWREEGGTAVTFGSDAHQPDRLGRDLDRAVDMVEAHGFRAGRHPYDVWHRPG